MSIHIKTLNIDTEGILFEFLGERVDIFRKPEDKADEDFLVATYIFSITLRNLGFNADINIYQEIRARFKVVLQTFIMSNPTVPFKNIGFSIFFNPKDSSIKCECKPCFITPDSCEIYKVINSPQTLGKIGMDFRVSDPAYFKYVTMFCSMLFLGNNFGTSDTIFQDLEKLMFDSYLELMKESGAQIWDNIFTLVYHTDLNEWQVEVRERREGKIDRKLEK